MINGESVYGRRNGARDEVETMVARAMRWGVLAWLAAIMGLVSACTQVLEPPLNAAEARLRAGTLPNAVPPVPPDGVLGVARDHFRAGNFGFAARYFEQAAAAGSSPEAWLGLAAAYDRLQRFDLADTAYSEAEPSLGATAAFLNNRGYSYLLRGDRTEARAHLQRALQAAPRNATVQNNLVLLDISPPARAIGRIVQAGRSE